MTTPYDAGYNFVMTCLEREGGDDLEVFVASFPKDDQPSVWEGATDASVQMSINKIQSDMKGLPYVIAGAMLVNLMTIHDKAMTELETLGKILEIFSDKGINLFS